MTIEIRSITEDELRPWIETVEAAFGADTHEGDVERWRRSTDPRRVIGAFDEGALVGGSASFTFDVTVPGGQRLPSAGVTAVGVLPTHRRRGILRQMMDRLLADAREAGEPLAVLWASEGVIYQRFGYGLATLNGGLDIEKARAGFRQSEPASGAIRLVDAATAGPTLASVYERVAAATPGFFTRNDAWWETHVLADPEHWRRGASRKLLAVHERDGQPTGYVLYRIKEDWGDHGSRSELRVQEMLGVDTAAERDLWEFIVGVDLIHRVLRWIGPPSPPLLLQLAQPELLGARLSAGMWLRILDVRAALEGRGYDADGELVLELADEMLPDCAGRWHVAVTSGRAAVRRTDAEPDIRMEINDLGSVYLGGFTFADLLRAGRTHELREGAARQADLIFASSVRPWCPQVF